MPTLLITTRDGKAQTVEGKSGLSLMEVLRQAGIDEVRAICGGCAACGTCHVYVAQDHAVRLIEMGDDESEMLGYSPHRRATSRLSCQIHMDDSLNGLQVTIAPEDE